MRASGGGVVCRVGVGVVVVVGERRRRRIEDFVGLVFRAVGGGSHTSIGPARDDIHCRCHGDKGEV